MGTSDRLGAQRRRSRVLAASGGWRLSPPSRRRPSARVEPPRDASSSRRSDPARGALPAPKSYFREERFQRGDTLAGFLERLGIDGGRGASCAAASVLQELRPGHHVQRGGQHRGRAARAALPHRARHAGQGRARGERPSAYRRAARSSTRGRDEVGRDPQLAVRRDGRRRHSRQRRHATRRHVQRRRRFPPRPAQGRPLLGGLRAALSARRARCARAACLQQSSPTTAGRSAPCTWQRLLHARRQEPAQGLHALAARILARELGLRHAPPPDRAGVEEAPGHRLRRADRHARARGGRRRRRVRRREGRLWKRGDSAPPRPVRHGVCAPEPCWRAPRRARGAERHHRRGGPTGWATGPHLHYEFRVAGQARNPFSIAMPAANPVAPQDLPAFRNHAAALVERLDLLTSVTVAQAQ